LAAFDVADVEEARRVVRVELEALLEIFAGFVEAAEVAIGEAEKGVRAGGGIDCDEMVKFFDGFFRPAGHEITFASAAWRSARRGASFMPDSRRGITSSK